MVALDESRPDPADPEDFVRRHRARIVGMLVRWCGDVQLAEDAFGEAVERALRVWPTTPPADPYAWVVTVAKNRVRDVVGSAEHRRTRPLDETDDVSVHARTHHHDDTLALMLACVHPTLDRGVHAPLILQLVLGIPTVDIANVFALPSATLSKRLVRAKQRLRADRASFEVPAGVPGDRVEAVLDAIYAAYSIEWLRPEEPDCAELVTEEAVHASQLMLAALPDDHEVRGLAALLLYVHARRASRFEDGCLVPTELQDTTRWDTDLIAHAEGLLRSGLRRSRTSPPGQYELQAAIQSAHASRRRDTLTPWSTIAQLYDALVQVTPSNGARVARAVALARATDPGVGLRILDDLAVQTPTIAAFQPYHAARAALLLDTDRPESARASLLRAIELCTQAPSRRFLQRQLERITPGEPRSGAERRTGSP